jgi:hypothetical protein
MQMKIYHKYISQSGRSWTRQRSKNTSWIYHWWLSGGLNAVLCCCELRTLSFLSRSAFTVTRTSPLKAKYIQCASLLLAVHEFLGTTAKSLAFANILRNSSQYVIQVNTLINRLFSHELVSAMCPVGSQATVSCLQWNNVSNRDDRHIHECTCNWLKAMEPC